MRTSPQGMTIVDVLIGAALFLIIFLALATVLRTSAMLSTLTKAQTGANTILASQMEYLRSLSYESIGTTSGTLHGSIPSVATTTLNGYTYVVRTTVEYVDDAHDGTGAGDSNSVTNDYKRVEISAEFTAQGTRTEKIVGIFTPSQIETSLSGGTLEIHVVNALGNPVSGASVRVVHSGVTPSIDTTSFTNTKGVALFSGITPSTGYQVFVSYTGYSSAQTHARTSGNANPGTGVLTVAKGQTTKSTFVIDTLASITLRTLNPDLSPRPSTSVTLRGARTLGTSSNGSPVYANTITTTTDASGSVSLSAPWDTYRITTPSGTVLSPTDPYQLAPGANATIDVVITP